MVKKLQRSGPGFVRTKVDGPATKPESKPERLARLEAQRTAREIGDQNKLTGVDTTKGAAVSESQFVGPMRKAAKVEGLPKKENAKYDFVFAGGGTAACVAAARMAERGLKVLIIEGGKDAKVADPNAVDPIEMQLPAGHGAASESPRIAVGGNSYMVKHFSDDAENAKDVNYSKKEGGFLYPRGEKIGGSGNMNAMIYVRPDDVDWDIIAAATGNPRWSSQSMKKIYTRIEKAEYRPILRKIHQIGKFLKIKALQNPHGLGQDGWLDLNRPSPKILLGDRSLLKMVWETAWTGMKQGTINQAITRLFNALDPNDEASNMTPGAVITPLAVTSDGRRAGPRKRLFEARAEHPDLIHIKDGCKVDMVLTDANNDAVGVRYRDADGKVHDVGTREGVIVACGAYETPAVMMRSGFGRKEDLEALGIACKADLRGMGEGLSDRYEYSHVFRLKKPLETLKNLQEPLRMVNELAQKNGGSEVTKIEIEEAAKNSPAIKKWLDGDGGALASNGAVIAFQAKSDPKMDDPDLYFFLVPGDFHGYHRKYSEEAGADANLMSMVILHENKTDQQGSVKLDPNDIHAKPLINFKYHGEEGSDEDDRLPLARGIVNIGRPLLESFGDIVDTEVWPGPQFKTIEQVAEKIGHGTWGHHANHTARMGDPSDPMTVVDGDLAVKGATNLYIADAAVLHNPGSFIVSSVMSVGEVMADIAEKKHEQRVEAGGFLGLNAVLASQLKLAKDREFNK